MARAYKKTYLNGAMRNLAVMMDCAVRKYGYPIEDFYEKFLASEVSRQFAKGNPRYLVGLSGAELADTVVETSGGTAEHERRHLYRWARILGWLGIGLLPVADVPQFYLHAAQRSRYQRSRRHVLPAPRG